MTSAPDPGLDLARLRSLRRPSSRTDNAAVGRIRAAVQTHVDRYDGYLAFSGGKDSLVVLDIVRRVEPDIPVVFFDSGLEFPETYSYVLDLARTWKLDLYRFPSEPPLLDVLVRSGQWDHAALDGTHRIDLHDILIGGPSRRAHEQLGRGELWGVRADESAGRRALYARSGRKDGVVSRADGTVAYGLYGTGPTPTSGPTSAARTYRSTRCTPSSPHSVFRNRRCGFRM